MTPELMNEMDALKELRELEKIRVKFANNLAMCDVVEGLRATQSFTQADFDQVPSALAWLAGLAHDHTRPPLGTIYSAAQTITGRAVDFILEQEAKCQE